MVMLVTHGPGWVLVSAGLGALANEFVRPRRLLKEMKDKVKRSGAPLWTA